MKASDYIARYLESRGIDTVFELAGGMITHILDSLAQQTKIRIVTMHHEQGAAFAAEGYARVKGLPGVALATSGPGATNLLTGIGSCFFDSVPAVFITGQVNRHEQKGSRDIRQLGFQETDVVSMALPITKGAFLVNDPAELPEKLALAFTLATSGRPGPVLLDIPMDVQRADIPDVPPEISGEVQQPDLASVCENLIADLKGAKRPLILVGRGVPASQTQRELLSFAEQTKVPIVTSLLAIDTVPYNSPLRVGFIGSYGNRWANLAFGACDLLIVLGSRLDIRQTGADTEFIERRRIYHVDCESGEINNRVKGCVSVHSDLPHFFDQFERHSQGISFEQREEWLKSIEANRQRWPDTQELQTEGINPNALMHRIAAYGEKAAAYVADVGSHQMWAAQSLEIVEGQRFFTSGGMGAMGFALPAAIGACIASDLKPVVVLVGDGSLQINIQELQTIVRNKLPIKIIVLNNRSLGMIRQFQDSYFEARYQSTLWGYDAPDFEQVALAYKIPARTIEAPSEVDNALSWLLSGETALKPMLLQVMINPRANAYPKIAFGNPITEMEPMVKPRDMEGT